jgi:hypothetical protein
MRDGANFLTRFIFLVIKWHLLSSSVPYLSSFLFSSITFPLSLSISSAYTHSLFFALSLSLSLMKGKCDFDKSSARRAWTSIKYFRDLRFLFNLVLKKAFVNKICRFFQLKFLFQQKSHLSLLKSFNEKN